VTTLDLETRRRAASELVRVLTDDDQGTAFTETLLGYIDVLLQARETHAHTHTHARTHADTCMRTHTLSLSLFRHWCVCVCVCVTE
jgi:hypothetical protein